MEGDTGDNTDGDTNPLNFNWADADWVQSGYAIQETIDFYLLCGAESRELAASTALDTVMDRLSRGLIYANSPSWYFTVENNLKDEFKDDLEIQEIFSDFDLSDENCGIIPQSFWNNLFTAQDYLAKNGDELPRNAFSKLNWYAGDFEFEIKLKYGNGPGPIEMIVARGVAFSVCFERNGLPGTQPSIGARAKQARRPKPKGNPPRLPDARLLAWWNGLDAKQCESSHSQLLDMCKAEFSDYAISRQRIRELAPHRKRGPKPIR